MRRSGSSTRCTSRRLFSMDDLARLIQNYPREHYSLVQTGTRGCKRVWREGDIGNLSGRASDPRRSPAAGFGSLCATSAPSTAAIASWSTRCSRKSPPSAELQPERPSGKYSDLLAGRASVLSRRPAGPSPGPDRRPQAGLRLSEHRAVHHAGASRGHRAVQCRSRSALQGMVRRSRQGARYRPRPDAGLGDERAAPGRESRHFQRLDDDLLHQ